MMLPRHSGVWVVCYKERVEILRDVSMCQVGKNKLMIILKYIESLQN